MILEFVSITNNNESYGLLEIKNTKITLETAKEKIDEVTKIVTTTVDCWEVDDIVERLPEDWECRLIYPDAQIEV